MDQGKMTPEQLVTWFVTELKKGQRIVVPEIILADTLTGLSISEGWTEEDLDMVPYNDIKSKHKHIQITLKKNAKA